jgi:selenocysteine-specific elongation factor
MNRYVILGTAGHIDHGKSALVKALTGTDPDRLKEEKERGITIDLGFADLAYPDGLGVGIVDMPGHERLIKNMLAGAGGIDIVLMVIAADEGIMPQSREHLDICNLLRVKRGLIAITKSDLVEEDWIPLVEEEVKEFVKGTFLEDADIIPLSAKTGANIDLLKEKIGELAANVELKSESGIFRLPVDRIFTLKGFGTVVTGTAVSGSIAVESNVEILPKGITSKVRGLQSHGKEIKKARAGQRVAINLQGVSKEDIQRGDVIAIPDKLRTAYSIDADIEILKNAPIKHLKNRSLVHFHTGTTELIGRIIIYDNEELKPGGRAFCQLRFKEPVTVMTGDRYIIRRFSPLMTIGGGEILDVSPKRRKREDRMKDLEVLEQGGLRDKLMVKIIQGGANGVTMAEISGWTKAEPPEIQREIAALVKSGSLLQAEGRIISQKAIDSFTEKTVSTINTFHKDNPLKPGIPKEALRAVHMGLDPKVFEALLRLIKEVVIEKDILRLDSFSISLSADKKTLKEDILKILENALFQPPSRDELAKSVSIKPHEATELLKLMAAEKTLVRINDSLYISMNNHKNMMDRLSAFFSENPEMTVAEFRDTLKTTRKFAIPFLEYLDSNKITLRVGEVRKFLKKL